MKTTQMNLLLIWSKIVLIILIILTVISFTAFFIQGSIAGFVFGLLCLVGIGVMLFPKKKQPPLIAEDFQSAKPQEDIEIQPRVRTADELRRLKGVYKNFAEQKSDMIFPCDSLEVISIVSSIMFEKTEKIIQIYTKNAYDEIWDSQPFFEAFKKHIDAGKRVQIFFEEAFQSETPNNLCFWYMTKNHIGNPKIVCKQADDEMKKEIRSHFARLCEKDSSESSLRLIIVDHTMFQWEAIVNNEFAGRATFNGSERLARIIKTFETHFSRSVILILKS